jgi:hypothetical protein
MSSSLAHSDPWVSLKEFILETETLHVLVSNWLGVALLETNDIDAVRSARNVFAEGWSFFQGFNAACLSRLLIPLLNLAIETINTTSIAADVGYSKLQSTDSQFSEEFEEECIMMVTEALTKQAHVLRLLEALNRSCDDVTKSILVNYSHEKHIFTSYDIENFRAEVVTWWSEMKKRDNLRDKNIAGTLGHESAPSYRSMMSVGGRHGRQLKQISSQRSKVWTQGRAKSLMPNPAGDIRACSISPYHVALSFIQEVRYKRPERFRKWGDEIALTVSNQLKKIPIQPLGEQQGLHSGLSQAQCRILLPYPTTAPAVPVELEHVHDIPNSRRTTKRCHKSNFSEI